MKQIFSRMKMKKWLTLLKRTKFNLKKEGEEDKGRTVLPQTSTVAMIIMITLLVIQQLRYQPQILQKEGEEDQGSIQQHPNPQLIQMHLKGEEVGQGRGQLKNYLIQNNPILQKEEEEDQERMNQPTQVNINQNQIQRNHYPQYYHVPQEEIKNPQKKISQ